MVIFQISKNCEIFAFFVKFLYLVAQKFRVFLQTRLMHFSTKIMLKMLKFRRKKMLRKMQNFRKTIFFFDWKPKTSSSLSRIDIFKQKNSIFYRYLFFRLSNKLVKACIKRLKLLKMFPVRLVKNLTRL